MTHRSDLIALLVAKSLALSKKGLVEASGIRDNRPPGSERLS